MPPFLFLRLPALALAEIIKQLDFRELINLKNCSLKTNFSIQRFRKAIPIELKLHYNRQGRHVEFQQIGSKVLGKMKMLSSDFETFKAMLDFFTQFKIENISFDFLDLDPQTAQDILEYAKKLKFKTVKFIAEVCSESVARSIFNLCSNASELYFHPDFDHFDFDNFRNFSMDSLIIKNSSWVKLDHVCAMKNILNHIELGFSRLTSQDVNIILKKWILSELNFKSMYLQMEKAWIDWQVVMAGVENEVRLSEAVFNVQRANGNNSKIMIGQSYVRFFHR